MSNGDVFSVYIDTIPFRRRCLKISETEFLDFVTREIVVNVNAIKQEYGGGYDAMRHVDLSFYKIDYIIFKRINDIHPGEEFLYLRNPKTEYLKINPIEDKWGNNFVAVNDGYLIELDDFSEEEDFITRNF